MTRLSEGSGCMLYVCMYQPMLKLAGCCAQYEVLPCLSLVRYTHTHTHTCTHIHSHVHAHTNTRTCAHLCTRTQVICHELLITNQIIHLRPPMEMARCRLIAQLHEWINTVTGLPWIQSSRYQVGVSEMQIPAAERG